MTGQLNGREWKRWLTAFCMLYLFVAPAHAANVEARKQQAREQFDNAERMRIELNAMSPQERSRRDYLRVMDAYRSVYYTSPISSKADASVMAVGELLTESGRAFKDEKSLRAAISQFEFLCREYPGSKYRFDALLTIGQIYKDDLKEGDKARETFQEVIRRFPHLQVAADARKALAEMDQQAHAGQKPPDSHPADAKAQGGSPQDSKIQQDVKLQEEKPPNSKLQDVKLHEAKPQDFSSDTQHGGLPLVTGIRHWSTPDYTRVAIDLEQEVKYQSGRVPNPDRIFFDLHDTRLSSSLVGKTFDVSDSFLRRVRVAQYQRNMVRVVLEVDPVSDYSAFLLPNPYRLIIDIHGRKRNTPQTLVARAQQERAQQQEEKRAPSPLPQPLAKTEGTTPASPAPPAAATPDAPHVALPATAAAAPAGKPGAEVGPRRADGSFFSHQSPPATESVAGSASKSASKNNSAPSASSTPSAGTEASRPVPSESAPASTAPASTVTASVVTQESAKTEADNLEGSELKATDKPTTEPTVEVVAPRSSGKTAVASGEAASGKRSQRYPAIHQAQPDADGQRSLIRALGLKVGRIVIDPGHGGHDTGSIGPDGLLEKDLVLDVSLRLGRLLQNKMGADVIYTRDDDTFVPLETRTAIANQQQADLFISIHANSSRDPSARGVETYYLNFNPSPDALEVAARENAVSEESVHQLSDLVKKIALKEKVEESREFAADVDHALYQSLEGKDRTLRDRGVKKAPFIVLIGANMPSILAEISFLSNPGDERKLETPEYRQKIAEALYKGIARYINGLGGVKYASKVGDSQ